MPVTSYTGGDKKKNEHEFSTPFLPDAYSSSGRTPLMVASANGSEEIVRLEVGGVNICALLPFQSIY